MKILVLEDDKTIGDLIATSLQKMNYEVILARDGEEAWQQFHRQSIDYRITDWQVPKMTELGMLIS